jgi:tetratricopeptide (TPR) repeat protein
MTSEHTIPPRVPDPPAPADRSTPVSTPPAALLPPAASTSTPPAAAPTDPLSLRLQNMQQEINALQNHVLNGQRPWWRDVAVIISVLTFLFSFATTAFAYRQAEEQRRQNAQIELRGLVQRLSALPRENIELTQTYTDTLVVGQLSGLIQGENILLAKQAASIMRDIPERTSASEYALVANAMYNSGLLDLSYQLLREGEARISDANDGVTIYRGQGNMLFLLGQYDEARAAYQRAMDIFERYPSQSAAQRAWTTGLTEMFWAQAEFGQGQCDAARRHIANAAQYAATLDTPGVPNILAQQVAQTQSYIDRCVPRPANTLGVPLPPTAGPVATTAPAP